MIPNQIDEKKEYKNYYRNNFRRLTNFLFFCCVAILIFIIAILYNYFTMPEPYYYVTSSNGELTQLMPVPKGTGLIDRGNTR